MGAGAEPPPGPYQDPVEVLERMCWVLRMAAHCLADSGAGETPLPPDAVVGVLDQGGQEAAAVVHAVGCLSKELLQVLALSNEEAGRRVCSARLMEVAVWAAAR